MINFIKYRRVFYGLSILMVGVAIFCIAFFGLNFGIDFTGGALLTVELENTPPELNTLKQAIIDVGLGDFTLQKSQQNQIIIKAKEISQAQQDLIVEKLNQVAPLKLHSLSFEQIGPSIGKELLGKTQKVVFLCLLCILLYIAFSFRKLKRPVKSWIYGFSGLLALAHDVLIPLGVFAILGRFYSAEITIPIITGFLTVFGYSINDTVVVFDRMRENLFTLSQQSFEEIANQSLNQTLRRSFNTAFTTMLALFAIFFFGGSTLRYFALALLLGIGLGTYSSIFLASPLIVSYYKLKQKRSLE